MKEDTICSAFIQRNLPRSEPFFQEMEDYAKAHRIPIIEKESLEVIKSLLLLKQPKRILEIGAAIGYSALQICHCLEGRCELTTIERDDARVALAKSYIAASDYGACIRLLHADAKETTEYLNGGYDFVFIDAAKAQYQFFFESIFPFVHPGGVILSDNIFFHNEVCADSIEDVPRRNKTIYKRLNEYIAHLVSHPDLFHTSLLNVGDGLALTVKH